MNKIRQTFFYKTYFDDFFAAQNEKVQEKILYVLFILEHEEQISTKFLKHIEGTEGLYEIRVQLGNNIFRVFCCFDEGKIVILFNGFQKKTEKTPKKEIEKALDLMNEYFETKINKND